MGDVRCPCGEPWTWSVTLRYPDALLHGHFCHEHAHQVAAEYLALEVDVMLSPRRLRGVPHARAAEE